MRKSSFSLIFALFLFLLVFTNSHANAQTSTETPPTDPESPIMTLASTSDATITIQLATPGEDGQIIHTVMAGESLISIAEAYGIPFNDLLALNGFTMDAVIYPGDEIIIQAGFTATPSPPPSVTPTQTNVPTSTRRPTRTPASPSPANMGQVQSTLTPIIEEAQPKADTLGTVLLVAIAILGFCGILMLIIGSLLRRSANRLEPLSDHEKVSED